MKFDPRSCFVDLCHCVCVIPGDTVSPCTKTDTKLETSIISLCLQSWDGVRRAPGVRMCKKLHVVLFSLCGFIFAEMVAKVLCFC